MQDAAPLAPEHLPHLQMHLAALVRLGARPQPPVDDGALDDPLRRQRTSERTLRERAMLREQARSASRSRLVVTDRPGRCRVEPPPRALPAGLARYEAYWIIGRRGFRYRALVHLEGREGGRRRPMGSGYRTVTACGHQIRPKPAAFRRGLAEHGGANFVLCPACVKRAQTEGVPVPPWRVGRLLPELWSGMAPSERTPSP